MNHIHCSNIEIAKAITPSGNHSYADTGQWEDGLGSLRYPEYNKHTLKTRILNRQVRISKVRLGFDLWLAREKTNRRIDGWKFCREIFDDLGEFSQFIDVPFRLLNSLISEKSRSKYFRQGAEAYINFHNIPLIMGIGRVPALSDKGIARECREYIRNGSELIDIYGWNKNAGICDENGWQ